MLNLNTFFGEGNWKKVSNKYYTFKRIIDDETITLVTNNIEIVKGSCALIVGRNKAVFLKDWQIVPIRNWNLQQNTYVVKLNKNFFKIYEFKNDFENFYIEKDNNFEDLCEIAKEQEKLNTSFAFGHF